MSNTDSLDSAASGGVVTAVLNNRFLLFGLGMLLFILMAIMGWNKLQYGFNFIDEGMYMTDGWRMAAGDRLFPDNSTNVTFLYTVFNEYIFRVNPDITLYGFRQLQYFCAIFSMSLLAISVYTWARSFWHLPYVLALFAFTGLDVNGMASNFSYYVYPHMFLTLHLAMLIFALRRCRGLLRDGLMAISGVCLWSVGFSLLPLSVTMISPVILWLLLKRLDPAGPNLSGRDMAALYLPAILAWLAFLSWHGSDFMEAALNMYGYVKEGSESRATLFISAIPYILISLMLVSALVLVGRKHTLGGIGMAGVLSAAIFGVVYTNLFGVVPPIWMGWFNSQMWFASLVVSSWVIVMAGIYYQYKKMRQLDDAARLLLLLLVPSVIMAGLFVFFSTLGPLTVQFVSIPSMLALAVLVGRWVNGRLRGALLLVLLLWPYYFSMAWADWKFTYFDLPPDRLSSTFKDGFQKGIKTNPLYFSIANWMQNRANQYSSEGDYAIVADEAPMGYMLIKRRPAMNHSWGRLASSMSLREDALAQMLHDKREPKIAFRFVLMPMYFPSSELEGEYDLGFERHMDRMDPVDDYLLRNMRHVESFVFQQRVWVKLYVR